MNEMVLHKAMKRTALDQPEAAAAACPALVIHAPRSRGAIGAIGLPSARKFPADRAGRSANKPADRLLTAAATMLGKDHATFLAAEVLASSVHRNILCPAGRGCCTSNLSLSDTVRAYSINPFGKCFLPHTPITLADGTMRAIEAIRPGDHVLSYAADGSLTPARVTRDRTEIARLSAEITKAEARIDSIVYALFDLTPDEIALLESVA